MASIVRDGLYALRLLRRSPAFTATAAAVLALGIGANAAIFSLLDAAWLRPLPFHRSDELVMMWERSPRFAHNRVSPLNFLDWSEQQRAFTAIAAVAGGSRTLTGAGGEAERIPGQAVTDQFFDLFAIAPLAGRTFRPGDAADARVVVLSEGLWRSRFGGDLRIVGRTLTLDGEAHSVIGIVPSSFQVLYRADMWTLFVPKRSPEQRRQHYLQVIGRRKPGVAIDQARSDMARVAEHIANEAPETNKGWSVTIEPLRDAIVGGTLKTTAAVLAAVVGVVLLMACANVANLLLARGVGRAREMAVRAAIGASRARLVSQLLVENLVLAIGGGAAGLAMGWIAIRIAPAIMPTGTLPEAVALSFDLRLIVVAASLVLLTTVISGVAPAWQASAAAVGDALAAAGRGITRRTGALRAALIVAEVAAAIVLLAGAGLLTRTLRELNGSDPGFRAEHVITGAISLPSNRYDSVDRLLAFYDSAERELAAIPGVTDAALGGRLPLDGWDIGQGFEIVGAPPVEQANRLSAHYQIVSAGYFRTLGIDVVRGRAFTPHDTTRSTPVCIVNEEFVRRFLPGREPVGTLLNVQSMDLRGGPTPVVREIVGVIQQVAEERGETQAPLEIYVPITQNPWFSASIAMRTAGDPLTLVTAMKTAIARVDHDLPVTRIRTMEEVAAEATSQPRFRAQLVGVFAATALALAAVGLFGVLAYSVSQRARELGIRVALGARTADVLRLVIGEAARLTALGIAIGLATAAAVTRFMATLLFAVRPVDPITFGGTTIVLVVTALAACAIPAWRATRIDPASALREE